jgi:ABC-2 type transport system ATP-binding protein
MEEAEHIADRVGIIDQGRIMVEGTPRELIDTMGDDTLRIAASGNCEAFATEARKLPYVRSVTSADCVTQIGVDHGNKRLAELVMLANQCDLTVEDISIAKPSLGDVFLQYTGRELRDK